MLHLVFGWLLVFSPSCHVTRAVNASRILLILKHIVDFSGGGIKYSAEREGFEPSVAARLQRFSRPPQSSTLAPLRLAGIHYTRLTLGD